MIFLEEIKSSGLQYAITVESALYPELREPLKVLLDEKLFSHAQTVRTEQLQPGQEIAGRPHRASRSALESS
jgi:hypothetical protein